VRDGEHLLRADDTEGFAASIGLVLSDSERGTALGRAGRSLVMEKYSWERAGARLEDLYAEVTADVTRFSKRGDS
jgi:glycosyltransferase involved in cell wall biosynthesis